MTRAFVLVLALTVGGCGFAQKHPGITAGLTAGTIGFGTCGISVEKLGTCSLIGAVAGLAIGGITGLVTTFADTGSHTMNMDEEEAPFVRTKTGTALPPADSGDPAGTPGDPAASASDPDARESTPPSTPPTAAPSAPPTAAPSAPPSTPPTAPPTDAGVAPDAAPAPTP